MTPELSIVTGTRNRPAELHRLIASIYDHTDLDWELIIADASDDPVVSKSKNVIVIPERPRLGCTAGYNVAFRRARGKWVMWLNDDCEVTPGYADLAIRFMENHATIGLGAFYYSDPNHSGFQVNKCCYGMLYANFGILLRTLGVEIGWFDEDLKMYGNDNSLAYRVLLAGKGIAAIPDAKVIHHSTPDRHRIENNDMTFRVAQAELLKAKYGPHLARMRQVYDRCQLVSA